MIVILGGYVWVVSTDEDDSLYERAEGLYKTALKMAEANDIKLHIHTPECSKECIKKAQKRRRR